jgi:Flp pilus assembly protein TadG
MMISKSCGPRRTGAETVEASVVLIWLLLFIMGVFEYGRFLMDWSILNHAAREGCRFALANNTDAAISTEVQSTVTSYMGSETASFTGLTVTVSGLHNGVSTAVNNLAAGDFITVSVTGTYKFLNVVPMIAMPSSYTMTSSVTMGCEGGT